MIVHKLFNNEDHEQENEKEAMMRVRRSAEIAQADGIRFEDCVHDKFLSEGGEGPGEDLGDW